MAQNTMVVIGWLSCRTCYLNVTKEEAVRLWMITEETEETPGDTLIDEFEFDNQFSAYDAWKIS